MSKCICCRSRPATPGVSAGAAPWRMPPPPPPVALSLAGEGVLISKGVPLLTIRKLATTVAAIGQVRAAPPP